MKKLLFLLASILTFSFNILAQQSLCEIYGGTPFDIILNSTTNASQLDFQNLRENTSS